MIVDTQATTHYNRAGLVRVKGKHMLVRMPTLVRTLYFEQAIAHCTSADITLFRTIVSQTPMFTLTMHWDAGQGVRKMSATCTAACSRVPTAIIVRMQRRWRRACYERQQRFAAIAMGGHARLGGASPLYELDDGLLRLVASFVR
jgi:hypothetical protein